MHTEHVEYLLPEYLGGSLDDSIRPGVEEHLKHCSSCGTTLQELRQTMEMLGSRKHAGPPNDYFSTVLPRVRQRLEGRKPWSPFRSPVLIRFILPAGAAAVALFIFLSLPFSSIENNGHDSLRAVLHGSSSQDLVNVVLDMVPMEPLSTPTVEGETSSMLGVRILRGEQLLASADEGSISQELVLDERMPEELERLNEADLETLVQSLSERTML